MNYSEKVMDHFMNPRNMGEIENASGVGTVGNAKCGDIMKVYLDIEDGIVRMLSSRLSVVVLLLQLALWLQNLLRVSLFRMLLRLQTRLLWKLLMDFHL